MIGAFKAIIALALFEEAVAGEGCPVWARAVGWALILAAFVVQSDK